MISGTSSMITMCVAYDGDETTPFDRDRWVDVHRPLVRRCWGPHGLERVGGFFPQGDGAGLIAVALRVFRDEAAMEAALASAGTARVMEDVESFTDAVPRRGVPAPS